MITIDGAQKSGSGTVVRYAVALAALFGQPLHLFNARAKRDKPGLRPQHLSSVLACAEMCGAQTTGLSVGCREFTFSPGTSIKGGAFAWDIGTAGSTTMLALSVLPLACFAAAPVTIRITGGVFQDFAPSPHHMQHVLLPLLRHMGLIADLRIVRAGYVPGGAGTIELNVTPMHQPLTALAQIDQGIVHTVSGIAFSSHLEERQVSARMAQVCTQHLAEVGLSCEIEQVYDTAASQAGASLTVWAKSSNSCIIGADRIGAPRRSSEAIGQFVATTFLEDLTTGATVDRHIMDQLVLFAALADGTSRYTVPRPTDHLDSNLWLVEQFGARVGCHARQVVIEGVGFSR